MKILSTKLPKFLVNFLVIFLRFIALSQSKVCGKLFKSSGEEKALRSEKISLGKHSTSQSHCLARDLDVKKLAASKLTFQVFEGFI